MSQCRPERTTSLAARSDPRCMSSCWQRAGPCRLLGRGPHSLAGCWLKAALSPQHKGPCGAALSVGAAPPDERASHSPRALSSSGDPALVCCVRSNPRSGWRDHQDVGLAGAPRSRRCKSTTSPGQSCRPRALQAHGSPSHPVSVLVPPAQVRPAWTWASAVSTRPPLTT